MAAVPYTAQAVANGFALCRDGVPVKTPAGGAYIVPTQALCEAMLAEWLAHKKPEPAKMPLTQLAATALDIVPKERTKIITRIAGFANSDLLCHRATEPELAERQIKVWQPLLDWCAQQFDALLRTGEGIIPIKQSPEVLKALQTEIERLDDFHLAALDYATHGAGSVVIALALAGAHIDGNEAFAAAELDFTYQMEKWGEDPAAVSRRAGVRRDLELCASWFRLLKTSY